MDSCSVLETMLLLEIKSNLILRCSELAIKCLSAFYRQGIVLGTAKDMNYEKGLLFSILSLAGGVRHNLVKGWLMQCTL